MRGAVCKAYYMKNQFKISGWHVFAVPMGINGLSWLLVQAKYFKMHIRSNICDLWHALAHQNWHKCHVRHHLFLSRQRIIDHLKPNTSAGHLYICVSFIFYVWTYICIYIGWSMLSVKKYKDKDKIAIRMKRLEK